MSDFEDTSASDLQGECVDEHPFLADLRSQIGEEIDFYRREESCCLCYATNPRKDHLYYNARQNKRFVSLYLSYANDLMEQWDTHDPTALFGELVGLIARLKADKDFQDARYRIHDALNRALKHENRRLRDADQSD